MKRSWQPHEGVIYLPTLGTQVMLKLLGQSQDSLAKGEKTYSTAEVRRRARAVQTASRSTA